MIIYLHGFRSSPQSFKARLIGTHIAQAGLANEWHCPQLPVSPSAAIALVQTLARGASDVTLIGSSLGGYYATWLAEQHGWRAVLLNPAILPQRDLSCYLGEQPLWHGDGSIVVEPCHLDELRALAVTAVTRPERYYLVAATGDEVLDYREMLAHYPGAETTLIQGGDHALADFLPWLDRLLAFCGAAPTAAMASA
jgi:predicted esterase YcpF (UPF0227 family)